MWQTEIHILPCFGEKLVILLNVVLGDADWFVCVSSSVSLSVVMINREIDTEAGDVLFLYHSGAVHVLSHLIVQMFLIGTRYNLYNIQGHKDITVGVEPSTHLIQGNLKWRIQKPLLIYRLFYVSPCFIL